MGVLGRWSARDGARCLPLVGLGSIQVASVLMVTLLWRAILVPLTLRPDSSDEDSTGLTAAHISSAVTSPLSPSQLDQLGPRFAGVLSITRLGNHPRVSPSSRRLSITVEPAAAVRSAWRHDVESTLTLHIYTHFISDLVLRKA